MFPSVDGIELVEQAKVLGVILRDNFSVNSHVNYMLTLCSQRIFLLKRLRDQGLNYRQLEIVFQAIVVSRILYALPGWGPFLSKELTGRINAFLKRSFRYGFAAKILEVNSLLDSASKDLFCNKGLTIVYLVYYLLRPHMNINCVNVVIILFCLGVKINLQDCIS